MHVRLAFSVAIQVDADILLIDEILAVGDAAFQQKCFDVFNEMRDAGKTIIFVTHDMGSMQALLSSGAAARAWRSPVYMGDPREVADRYLELNFGRDPERRRAPRTRGPATARRASSRSGSRTSTASASPRRSQGRRLSLARPRRISWSTSRTRRRALYVLNEEHKAIIVATTGPSSERSGTLPRRRRGRVLVHVRQRARARPLQPDDHARPPRLRARRDRPLRGQLLVRCHRHEALGGVVDLPVQVGIRRTDSALAPGDGRVRAGDVVDEAPVADPIPYEALGRPIRGPRALNDDWARFWHLTYNIARHAVEAALLRLGARLSVAAGAPAAAVRRAVCVLHRRSRTSAAGGPGGRFYGTQLLGSIVLFTFFAEATGGRGAQRGRQRDAGAQDPVPAAGHPALDRAPVGVQPRAQPRRRAHLRAHPGRAPDADLARAAADPRAAGRARSGLAMLLVALFVYFRDVAADLGGRHPGPLLRLAGDHPAGDGQGEAERRSRPHLHVQPAGDRAAAVPPRDGQPRGAERGLGARRSARSW